jgi:hypothetical protein
LNQPEIDFWIQNVNLSEDSFMVVDQNTRTVLDILHKQEVLEIEKGGNLKCLGNLYKGMCFEYDESSIKFVRGKNGFFKYELIGNKIQKAVEIFQKNQVPPIYAQLLLLIESPNNPNAVSIAGAVGYFQLMPHVAKSYGLTVNKYRDDRRSFELSAVAAAKLFKNYCIPNAKSICDGLKLPYDEQELWFQLLALHIYNAGAGNVRKAAYLHEGSTSGVLLIKKLWHTRLGHFGNSSQNYSQLCLASYRAYHDFIMRLSVTNLTNPEF